MAALCVLIFTLAATGAAIAVRMALWSYLIPLAYFAVVALLVYVQLPHDESYGGEHGD